MGTRTISIPEDVHALLTAQKQPGESFGDLLRRRMVKRQGAPPQSVARKTRIKALIAGHGRRTKHPYRPLTNVKPLPDSEWRHIYAREELEKDYAIGGMIAIQAFPGE